jgi:hypothetical protein
MATVQLIRRGTDAHVGDAGGDPGADPGHGTETPGQSANRAAVTLLGTLIALLAYTAFAHGATSFPAEARVQVAIAALAAIAAAGWLYTGSLRLVAPKTALAGVAALAAFAVWSGVTVLWSVAPDQTWIELNRTLTYVIVLGLAIAAGASQKRSIETLAIGYLLIAFAVTLYALGGKLVPGLHISGLFDLNQTGQVARLRAPLDYWNALGLFVAMAIPVAACLAADESRTHRVRLAALAAVELIGLTVGLTYSRGGLIALVVALAVGVGLGGARLKTLALLAIAGFATLPPLLFALGKPDLVNGNVPLAHRESAGAELAAILAVSLLVLYGLMRLFFRLEHRTQISARRARGIGRLLVALAAAMVALFVVSLAASSRGLDGSVSTWWHKFTSPHETGAVGDPFHLRSDTSGNRWVWWKEATGAWSDKPIAGWGAGSFPVTHLLYRRDTLPVRQPHSVPLQFLAETGIVGALLALGGYGLLLAAGVGTVRRREPGSGRMLAAAVLAGAIAYAVHAWYDWDWDIPGVTLPALVFLGVLAGARAKVTASTALPGPSATARVIGLGAMTLVLCVFAASAALPSLSAGMAKDALVAASSASPARLGHAQATAELAARLNPLSDDGLKSAATVASHRGDPARARAYLLDAVRRAPSDVQAWAQLANIELQLGDPHGALRAAGRVLALDPESKLSRSLASQANQQATPPNASPSATGTPLPAG